MNISYVLLVFVLFSGVIRLYCFLLQHQEQDPTNLYFANLPLNFKENDLESLLSKYGNVVSTRVLRDEVNISKGVGFAR